MFPSRIGPKGFIYLNNIEGQLVSIYNIIISLFQNLIFKGLYNKTLTLIFILQMTVKEFNSKTL